MLDFSKISSLVSTFEESATLALSGRAKKMSQEGRSIVNFGVGEPDFNTPDVILEAAFAAARVGHTKYTAVSGTPQLRRLLAEQASSDYRVPYSADEVLCSTGGKQAIYHFLQTVIERNDEVLILSPYWVSFPEMVKLVGGKPVIVKASKGQRITAEDLKRYLSEKTKCLILNSPSNPAGLVISEQEMSSYLDIIAKREIWVLSDDTYNELVYPPARWVSPLHIQADFKNRTCLIGSFSKTFAMTGWRLGWAMAPKLVIEAMTKLQSQVTSSPCSISQAAGEVAIKNLESIASDFRTRFQIRRDLILKELKTRLPNAEVYTPEGAFYIFLKVSSYIQTQSVAEFALELLEKDGVCVIPGEAFGENDYIRLSYALSEPKIIEGINRLEKALKS